MVRPSIDYLFTDHKSTKPTQEWAKLLRANKDKYANCRVVSITRVKDLNSDWKHEYLQFVVIDTSSNERTRVYVERGNEIDLDWVTFGPAETIATGSKHENDLPLPLTSLIFGGKSGEDFSNSPTVLELAEILAATTRAGGAYALFGHSCFWYAYTAYDAVKRRFGEWAEEVRWQWGDIGGAGNAGIQDLIGLGWPTLFKDIYEPYADSFKSSRESSVMYYDEIIILPVADLEPEKQNQFISAMKDVAPGWTEAEIRQRLQVGSGQAKGSAIIGANWAEEFHKLNEALVERTRSDANARKYLELYQSFEVSSEMNEVAPEGLGNSDTKEALEVAVGYILEEALKHQ